MGESFEDWIKRKEERKTNPKPKSLRKTPLRPVSKKQKKKLKDYAQARQEHYSVDENKKCHLCGRTENLSIHHTRKRGSLVADKEHFVTLCIMGDTFRERNPELNLNSPMGSGCHALVEANKKWARENGLLE